MAPKTVTLLSRESLDRIHAESLRILKNVGIRVENRQCRAVLKEAGAQIMGRTDVMRLPPSMVEQAMGQLTKEFELLHPTGERFTVPDGTARVGTRVKMPRVLDYGATSCRPPCRQDVVNLCRITNALPKAEFTLAIQFPSSDVPPEIDVADTLGLVYAMTGHLSVCAPGRSRTRGRRSTWRWSPPAATASSVTRTFVEVNTTTPLVLGNREGSIILHVVGRHCPIDIGPMPIAGVATPATLAGNLTVGNAEALFLCTLANAIWPGAKSFMRQLAQS